MKGRKPKKALPTEAQTAILRRLARPGAKLIVTMINGDPEYTYESGEPVSWRNAERLVNAGWVRPESKPLLLGERPQSYVIAR